MTLFRITMLVGLVLFFCGMRGRDYLDRQAVNHALASLGAYAKAHPTDFQGAKFDEIFKQENAEWLKERRFQRVGLDVACYAGLAMQAFSVFVLLRKQKRQ